MKRKQRSANKEAKINKGVDETGVGDLFELVRSDEEYSLAINLEMAAMGEKASCSIQVEYLTNWRALAAKNS